MRRFAEENDLPIVADIPRSDEINTFEEEGKTVIEGDRTLPISKKFLDLAELLLQDAQTKSNQQEGGLF